MKTIFLALLITFIAPSLFAQRMILKDTQETWVPESFDKLSESEQAIISGLNPVSEKNKQFLQLMFDAGSFSNCGVGTALRSKQLFITVIDKEKAKKYSFVLSYDRALVNDNPYRDTSGIALHAVVFDQNTKSENGLIPQTVIVYFLYLPSGDMHSMRISTKTKKQVGLFSTKVETSYQIDCKSK